MTENLESELLAAAAALLAAALLTAGVRLSRPRTGDSTASLPALDVFPRAAAIAAISTLAATSLRVAVALMAGNAGAASSWTWLVRTETVAFGGGVLLICLLDSGFDRSRLLLGAGLAGGLTWALGQSPGLLPSNAPFEAPGVPLLAAVFSALLQAPGPTARLVRRLRYAAALATEDHLLVIDESGRLVHASDAALEALGLPERSAQPFSTSEPMPDAYGELTGSATGKKTRLRTGTGRVFETQATPLTPLTPWRRAQGVLLRDVTNEYRAERRLVRLAHYDSLTGLANRRLFLETLTKLLASAGEDSGRVALYYIDLDDFKAINDSLGHGAGDTLLKSLAERFITHLGAEGMAGFRLSPRTKLIVARLAGDEFAVIAPGVADAAAAGEVARFILEVTRQPLELADRTVNPSASIGIALFPEDGRDVETLLRHADSALYLAKRRGRHRFALYEQALGSQARRALALEQGLRQALGHNEMRLHFQPKLDTVSGHLVGFEALLRWRSPELGDVRPAEFIPVAEKRGLITSLGTWCIDEACRQLRAWRDAGYALVPVAVNVSSAQFSESDLRQVVSDALRRHGVEPRHLELELTESLLIGEKDHVDVVLRDLRSMGVRVALDDFGTGYSALTYLNRFQLDVLKMDRGLLRDIDSDPSALGIASAVVAMSHSLGLSVVAEGVDEPEQVAILRTMACDHIQGFLFSPALPAADVEAFMHPAGGEAPAFDPGMVARTRKGSSDPLAEKAQVSRFGGAPALQPATAAAAPSAPASRNRVLLVDDGRRELGPVALRLSRLGIDSHYATSADEARLFVSQEGDAIRVVAAPSDADMETLRPVLADLAERSGEERRLIAIGERPDDATRASLRDAGVEWALFAPYNDAEIRYVVRNAMAPRRNHAHHRQIRVPVDLVANIRCGRRREVVVVSSLSSRGAFIELSPPLPDGSSLRIELELPGDRFCGFARVVYTVSEDDERPEHPSGIGVAFYGSDPDSERFLRKAVSELEARYQP